MTKSHRWVGLFAASLMLVSGCASNAPEAKSASAAPSAAEPSAGPDTGAVQGTVVDEEQRPIPAADVTILSLQRTTKTDANGSFTLNDILPGSYALAAQALGYEASGKKVDVVAGEVASVSIVLVAMALAEEPYYVPLLRTGFINVDQTWVTFVVHDLGGHNHSAVCGTCIFALQFPKGAVQMMTEHTWTQTGIVAYNDGVHLTIRAGQGFDNWEFCWREQRSWSNTTIIPPAQTSGTARIAIQSSFAGISFQHRVDMWTTLAYVGGLPDGYSALPPTTEKRQDPTICTIK